MYLRNVLSTLTLAASVAVAVDIPAEAPPPDGLVPFGLDEELGPLIRDIVNEPTQVGRYKKVVAAGQGFVFDFINGPINQFNGKGGFFSLQDDSNFPGGIGSGMAIVLLVLAPCGMLAPHYQPRANEYGYLISGGPMRWGMFFETGGPLDYEFMQVGQGLMFPKGSMHYGSVLGCDPTLVLAGFDSEDPGFNLAQFAFWGFDDEAIAASEGTYGDEPVDFDSFPAPLNTGLQQCLDRCGIDRSVFDVGQVTKLQLMQASFTAYAKRVMAGNLSTFTPLGDLDFSQISRTNIAPLDQFGIPEVATAAIGPGSISGASTIGNLSGVNYLKQGAGAAGAGSAANAPAGNAPSGANPMAGMMAPNDPMINNVNHAPPSSWMTGQINSTGMGMGTPKMGGTAQRFGAAADNNVGGSDGELKSYRIATYTLASTSGLFIVTTFFLLFAVSRQKRDGGSRVGGGRPLMAQAYDS